MVTSFSGGGSRSTRRETSTKEKKKKIIIKVENIGPNKIVVCTEMVMYLHNCRGSGGSMS
jgi:hypothetical protein